LKNVLPVMSTEKSKDTHPTRRAVADGIEPLLYEAIPVLDHGFVRVIDYMGNDAAITQAARVSYGSGTKQVQQDRGLIRYLMRHWHTTPFEMCEIKLHVKLPIFVARQWIRHRTANVNEYSARYSIMDKEFYLPSPEHCAPQSQNNKQGRQPDPLSPQRTAEVLEILKQDATRCYDDYIALMNTDETGQILNEGTEGLARELARMNLTLNYYTQWYWKIDLHNLFHFLYLRADRHAQYEIRVYADVIYDIVKQWVPVAAEAFEEYRLHGAHLSKTMVTMVQKLWRGEPVDQGTSGLSAREWDDFMAVVEP